MKLSTQEVYHAFKIRVEKIVEQKNRWKHPFT